MTRAWSGKAPNIPITTKETKGTMLVFPSFIENKKSFSWSCLCAQIQIHPEI
jgi:hypothetical protein